MDIPDESFMHNGKNLREIALSYRKKLESLGFMKTNDGELAAFLCMAKNFPNKFIC